MLATDYHGFLLLANVYAKCLRQKLRQQFQVKRLGQSPSRISAVEENRHLAADRLAAGAREDRSESDKARPVLLVASGREASYEKVVWGDAPAGRSTAPTQRLERDVGVLTCERNLRTTLVESEHCAYLSGAVILKSNTDGGAWTEGRAPLTG